MTIKRDSSKAKQSKNVPAGKRHGKLIAPKGEKISSMKTVDASSPILFDKCPPVHH
jgi:hypothetical protein